MTQFTSTQAYDLYVLLQPEIETVLDRLKKDWIDLVDDPTAYTEQEAIEKSVEIFHTFLVESIQKCSG